MKKIKYLLPLFIVICCFSANAQKKSLSGNDKAMQILDKAMGQLLDNSSVGIYFEGIAYDIINPVDIFRAPVYQIYKGGFLFVDGNKYEMQLGKTKTLCDGKIVVVIDEDNKTIVIDSLNNSVYSSLPEMAAADSAEMNKVIDELFGDATLSYEGQEMINGALCDKVFSESTDKNKTQVIYWVNNKTGKLLLMAQRTGKNYDAYWVKNIAKAPAQHNYAIHFPKHEITEFHGYDVIDNRFSVEN